MQLLDLLVLGALALSECNSQLVPDQSPDLPRSRLLRYQYRHDVVLLQVVARDRRLFYLLFRREKKLDFLWEVLSEKHKFHKTACVRYLMFDHWPRRTQVLRRAISAGLATWGQHNVYAHVSED